MTKTTIITKEDMIFAANKLIGLGAKNVLIKGGHLKHKNVIDILINKKRHKDLQKVSVTKQRIPMVQVVHYQAQLQLFYRSGKKQ